MLGEAENDQVVPLRRLPLGCRDVLMAPELVQYWGASELQREGMPEISDGL